MESVFSIPNKVIRAKQKKWNALDLNTVRPNGTYTYPLPIDR